MFRGNTEQLLNSLDFISKRKSSSAADASVAVAAAAWIEDLESDLESAVEVAFNRGATEWTHLNYPAQYKRLTQTEPTDG